MSNKFITTDCIQSEHMRWSSSSETSIWGHSWPSAKSATRYVGWVLRPSILVEGISASEKVEAVYNVYHGVATDIVVVSVATLHGVHRS